MVFDANACAASLAEMLQSWQTYFKYSIHYLGSSFDSNPADLDSSQGEPEYFKFRTSWTYENELQPIAARSIDVEFTLFNPDVSDVQDYCYFRVDHEQLVRQIPSTHPRDQSIDLILLRILNQKRVVATEWRRDARTNPFLASRMVSKPLDEELKLDWAFRPEAHGGDSSFVQQSARGKKSAARFRAQYLHAMGAMDMPEPNAERVQLENRLVNMFRLADRGQTGTLDRNELCELLLVSDLGISQDEIPIILAAADEDEDGRISYAEFVPIGLDICDALALRRAAQDESSRKQPDEANSIAHSLSEQAIFELIDQACDDFGISLDDVLNRSELKDMLFSLYLNLTKLEVNSVLARIAEPSLTVQEFKQRFPKILQEVYANSVLLYNTSDLELYLIDKFRTLDASNTGSLLPQQLKEALLNLPMVTLSRIQVFSIMAEAQQGEDGKVKYQPFAKTAAAFINRLFDPQLVARRSDMLFRSALTPVELLNGVDKSELQDEMRQVFAQFDTEASGYLTAAQFRSCLQATSLALTPKQVTALMNVADLDGDGLVDYAEFSRFAYDVLLAVARESALQQLQA